MTDTEWNEEVRRRAITLSSLFGAIASEAPANSVIGIMARKGGLAALALCGDAAKRNIDAGLAADQQAAAEGEYDLAGLASLPMTGPELGE